MRIINEVSHETEALLGLIKQLDIIYQHHKWNS